MNKTAAYHEWLGIPLKDVTPNHYELLGVPLFEANTTVISNGAARRVSFLQTMVAGEYAELAQEIQKEVSQAKLCLMREASRLDYQNQLMETIASSDSKSKSILVDSAFSVVSEFESLDKMVHEIKHHNRELSQQKIWLIGSADDCDLIIKNQYVSRKHCLLFKNGDQFELEDWASTNGTCVNDAVLQPRVRTPISTDDIITLGRVTLMPWPPLSD